VNVVILRNLTLNGLGTSLDGIKLLAGKALYVESVVVTGFDKAIQIVPSADDVKVSVKDTSLRNAASGALLVEHQAQRPSTRRSTTAASSVRCSASVSRTTRR